MPLLTTDDGVKLHYEDVGSGIPIVFVHEFAGDCRSLGGADAPLRAPLSLHRLQRARLSAVRRAGRCRELFAGTARATTSARCSTRSSSTRRTSSACRWAASRRCISASPIRERARSLVVAGCGYGAARRQARAVPPQRSRPPRRASRRSAWPRPREGYALGPRACSSRTRTRAAGASSPTSSPSIRRAARRITHARRAEARGRRCSTWSSEMKTITVPTLVVTGDEDWPCLEPALLMKRTIPTARPRRHAELAATR